jgi:hypothetical protein
MVVIDWPIDACEHKTPDASEVHAFSHQSGGARHRGPKMERPRIDIGVETELWNTFVRCWETFRIGSDIDNIAAPRQLLQCARESLCDVVLKADPLIAEKNTQEVLDVMHAHAVIPVPTGVLRRELVQMQQGPDKLFRNFAARVRGKAERTKDKARNALLSASASVPSLSSVSTFKKLNAAQKHDPASTGAANSPRRQVPDRGMS